MLYFVNRSIHVYFRQKSIARPIQLYTVSVSAAFKPRHAACNCENTRSLVPTATSCLSYIPMTIYSADRM